MRMCTCAYRPLPTEVEHLRAEDEPASASKHTLLRAAPPCAKCTPGEHADKWRLFSLSLQPERSRCLPAARGHNSRTELYHFVISGPLARLQPN